MKNKTTNNKQQKKVVINKNISLPKYVALNPTGTFRVRKQLNGNLTDITFKKLNDAKAYIKMNNWK